ncbi:MAG: GNAT family N-acetyltransferase [Acidimicrobiia bacterium]
MNGARRAAPSDLSELKELVRAFYEIDRHEYDEARVSAALAPLLEDDSHGQVWVVPVTGPLAGYAVVTWSWSLESGGRDAILDEIYVEEQGQGSGSELLLHAVRSAAETGAARMYLETESHNFRVRRFYERNGFTPDDSIWMSRDIEPTG